MSYYGFSEQEREAYEYEQNARFDSINESHDALDAEYEAWCDDIEYADADTLADIEADLHDDGVANLEDFDDDDVPF